MILINNINSINNINNNINLLIIISITLIIIRIIIIRRIRISIIATYSAVSTAPFVVPSAETHFFSGEGGGRLFERGAYYKF